jgi:hypothetical protein
VKNALLLLLLVFPQFATGQNYQCLQPGSRPFFTNRNGYLRCIKIDSVTTEGDTTVYHLFRTPRGAYNVDSVRFRLDSFGGSWTGKRVLQLRNGNFVFDNYWGASVTIKTTANVGDSWTFYRDTGHVFYRASLVSMDTQRVLSVLDSVKTIVINAYDTSGMVATDPLNGFTILLSKNHGFKQVFDLFTFPYHKPDSSFRPGLDFYLDRSTSDYRGVNSDLAVQPDTNNAIFNIVDFIIPVDTQLYNVTVGDVLEYRKTTGILFYTDVYHEYTLDTIIAKAYTPGSCTYTVKRTTFADPSAPAASSTITFSTSNTNYSVCDTQFLPESHRDGIYIFYFPEDGSFCFTSPRIIRLREHYYRQGLGGNIEWSILKLGLSEIEHFYADGEPTHVINELIYLKHNGAACGSFVNPTTAVTDLSAENEKIRIYPCPSNDLVHIQTALESNAAFSVTNCVGEVMYRGMQHGGAATIEVANFPAGVYFITIREANKVTQSQFLKQ